MNTTYLGNELKTDLTNPKDILDKLEKIIAKGRLRFIRNMVIEDMDVGSMEYTCNDKVNLKFHPGVLNCSSEDTDEWFNVSIDWDKCVWLQMNDFGIYAKWNSGVFKPIRVKKVAKVKFFDTISV